MTAIALLLLAVLYATPVTSGGSRLLMMSVVILVIAHRTAAVNLSSRQVLIRHYLTVIPALLLPAQMTQDELASILRLGGMLLLSGVALSMTTCFYNEWKASREESPAPA
jgi:hypothetical protein